MSIIRKIKDYYSKKKNLNFILFTTPSHSQGDFIVPKAKSMLGEKFFKCDFSETDGFDNLRNPTGVLKNLLDKLSVIYKSKQTFLLTNGSTSGIIAILNTVVKENEEVLVARNCHISVYNALVLTGAKPIWFTPEYDEEWGIYKGIAPCSVEKIFNKKQKIKALVITSPTYEGIFSDIKKISAVCKKHNVKLIVDEAHGALLNFGDFLQKPSILCGADASVHSLHKTAGGLNPCALLHIAQGSTIDTDKVQDSLNLINTTSPSYPLMLSAEAAVEYLNSESGKKHIQDLINDISNMKKLVNKGVTFYEGFCDPTKLLLKIQALSGYEAAEIMYKEYGIEEEFSNNMAMLFITGIGTTKTKLEKLKRVLNRLTKIKSSKKIKNTKIQFTLPEQKYTPRTAYYKESEEIIISDAVGRISAQAIVNYPPGIPILIPGEIITEELIKTLEHKTIRVCK